MNWILVSSHRRSGTHFLIDSIRANINQAWFPNHFRLPADFNIGSLYGKDEKVYNIFSNYLNTDKPVIIKSHLLPEEMNLEQPRDKHEKLIKEIYLNSKKIYVRRNGKDTLVSLYHFLNPEVPFSTFLRTPNEHISRKVRSEKPIDENRVQYWAYNVQAWHKVDGIHHVEFEDLKDNYDRTIREICIFLGQPIPDTIRKPSVPKMKMLHALQKKLSFFGLASLPESSSVRPRKGQMGDAKAYFTKEDKAYFQSQVERVTLANAYK